MVVHFLLGQSFATMSSAGPVAAVRGGLHEGPSLAYPTWSFYTGNRSEHTLHCVSIRTGLQDFLQCLERSALPADVQQKNSLIDARCIKAVPTQHGYIVQQVLSALK